MQKHIQIKKFNIRSSYLFLHFIFVLFCLTETKIITKMSDENLVPMTFTKKNINKMDDNTTAECEKIFNKDLGGEKQLLYYLFLVTLLNKTLRENFSFKHVLSRVIEDHREKLLMCNDKVRDFIIRSVNIANTTSSFKNQQELHQYLSDRAYSLMNILKYNNDQDNRYNNGLPDKVDQKFEQKREEKAVNIFNPFEHNFFIDSSIVRKILLLWPKIDMQSYIHESFTTTSSFKDYLIKERLFSLHSDLFDKALLFFVLFHFTLTAKEYEELKRDPFIEQFIFVVDEYMRLSLLYHGGIETYYGLMKLKKNGLEEKKPYNFVDRIILPGAAVASVVGLLATMGHDAYQNNKGRGEKNFKQYFLDDFLRSDKNKRFDIPKDKIENFKKYTPTLLKVLDIEEKYDKEKKFIDNDNRSVKMINGLINDLKHSVVSNSRYGDYDVLSDSSDNAKNNKVLLLRYMAKNLSRRKMSMSYQLAQAKKKAEVHAEHFKLFENRVKNNLDNNVIHKIETIFSKPKNIVKPRIIVVDGKNYQKVNNVVTGIVHDINIGKDFIPFVHNDQSEHADIQKNILGESMANPGKLVIEMVNGKSTDPFILFDRIDSYDGKTREKYYDMLINIFNPLYGYTTEHYNHLPISFKDATFIITVEDVKNMPKALQNIIGEENIISIA